MSEHEPKTRQDADELQNREAVEWAPTAVEILEPSEEATGDGKSSEEADENDYAQHVLNEVIESTKQRAGLS